MADMHSERSVPHPPMGHFPDSRRLRGITAIVPVAVVLAPVLRPNE